MYVLYTAVLHAALPCSHEKITIFRDALKVVTKIDKPLVTVCYLIVIIVVVTLPCRSGRPKWDL